MFCPCSVICFLVCVFLSFLFLFLSRFLFLFLCLSDFVSKKNLFEFCLCLSYCILSYVHNFCFSLFEFCLGKNCLIVELLNCQICLMMIAYWTNSNRWTSAKKKRERKKRNRKQLQKRKKERKKKKHKTVAKKKVWKRFRCLIFEHKIKAVRGIFEKIVGPNFGNLPRDSPLNSERFDI